MSLGLRVCQELGSSRHTRTFVTRWQDGQQQGSIVILTIVLLLLPTTTTMAVQTMTNWIVVIFRRTVQRAERRP